MCLSLSLSLSFGWSNLSKVTNLCLTLTYFYWLVVLPLMIVERTGGPGDGNDDHFDEEGGEKGSSRDDAFGPDLDDEDDGDADDDDEDDEDDGDDDDDDEDDEDDDD